jgi:hypothetical protein
MIVGMSGKGGGRYQVCLLIKIYIPLFFVNTAFRSGHKTCVSYDLFFTRSIFGTLGIFKYRFLCITLESRDLSNFPTAARCS